MDSYELVYRNAKIVVFAEDIPFTRIRKIDILLNRILENTKFLYHLSTAEDLEETFTSPQIMKRAIAHNRDAIYQLAEIVGVKIPSKLTPDSAFSFFIYDFDLGMAGLLALIVVEPVEGEGGGDFDPKRSTGDPILDIELSLRSLLGQSGFEGTLNHCLKDAIAISRVLSYINEEERKKIEKGEGKSSEEKIADRYESLKELKVGTNGGKVSPTIKKAVENLGIKMPNA